MNSLNTNIIPLAPPQAPSDPIEALPQVHMVTIKELSKLTGVSEHHIRLLCKSNRIRHIMAGTKYLINYERFIDYLNT